jgi:hypothetical protein
MRDERSGKESTRRATVGRFFFVNKIKKMIKKTSNLCVNSLQMLGPNFKFGPHFFLCLLVYYIKKQQEIWIKFKTQSQIIIYILSYI